MKNTTGSCKKSRYGITLTELLITILVGIILLLSTKPLFNQMHASLESIRTMMLITDLIQQARNRAFTHHKRIVLCGTTDHRLCSADNWNHGILMFIDGQHHDRIRQENENLLYANALTLRYGQLYWKGAGGNNILFKPNTGMARGANGSFYYCAVDAKHSRRLYLSYMGHTRIEKINNCDDI